MIIPENTSVIVIDDDINEGIPLLKTLSSLGIPATYFTGDMQELPSKKFYGVRVVFLDLFLMPGDDPEKQIPNGINVLRNIISIDNGIFFIVVWTKYEKKMNILRKGLKKEGFKFVLISWPKNSFKDTEGNFNFATNIMTEKLNEKMSGLGVFQLFMMWENIVQKSSSKIVKDFSDFYDFDKNWNEKLANVFLKLAEGFSGRHLAGLDDKEKIKSALLSFNSAFMDTLESEIRKYNTENVNISFSDAPTSISNNIIGRINTKFMIEIDKVPSSFPGNVYYCNHIGCNIKKVDKKELFDSANYYQSEKAKIYKIRHIIVEISPMCDFLQNKRKICRMLPGVLIPEKYGEKIKKNAGYIYKSEFVEFEKKIYYLVFDLRFFCSIAPQDLEGEIPIFRLRHQLLIDIQSKLASHVNRPGVMSVR